MTRMEAEDVVVGAKHAGGYKKSQASKAMKVPIPKFDLLSLLKKKMTNTDNPELLLL